MEHAADTLFHRMRYTPMRDWLRGRLTARLDIDGRLQAAALPEPAEALIRRVVRRTRLWRLEKAEVADELIDHFAGGIEAGRTIEAMISSFGDPSAAAKLIRRAKRRNRPLAWHAMIFLRRVLVAMIIVYLLLGLYYLSARPAPSVNYIALLDDKIAATPADQRAWPMYREAIRGAGLMPFVSPGFKPVLNEVLRGRPGQPQWPATVEWLMTHADALEIARQAAHKPVLGITLGPGGAWDDPVLYPPGADHGQYTLPPGRKRNPLLNAPQGHIVALWHIADALASDAYLARQQKDLERLLRDIESINRLADQLREHDLVPTAGHIPLVLREIALDAAIHALAAPQIDAFTLSQLQRLAHLFAAPGTAAQLLTFEHDRTMLRDLVQHVYSDDGSGDGRLTPQGVDYLAAMRSDAFAPREMNAFSWYFNDPRRALDHYRRAVGPLLPLLVASRRELLDTGERLIDLGEARLARPWWQADWDSLRQQLSNWRQSPTMRLKYTPLLSFLPAMESFHAAAERYLGRRDGLLIAIALEAYRREHGLYPESLDALMPALLPTVPTDRITGRPLRYRLVDGETRVYSVGADGDDDGGRAPTYRGQPAAHRAGPRAGSRAPEDGDWLLWPPTP